MHRTIIAEWKFLMATLLITACLDSRADGFIEGQELIASYQAWQRVQANTSKAQMDVFLSGVFLGYVVSTADSFVGVSSCFKEYVKRKKIVKNELGEIVGRYILSHSADSHEPGASLALRAFITSSGCTK